MQLNKKTIPRILLITALAPTVLLLSGIILFQWYIDGGAKKLVKLENQGLLSHTYGYVWQQINANREIQENIERISTNSDSTVTTAPDSGFSDYPSLSAVRELNSVRQIDRTVSINDRYGIPLSVLKSVQTSTSLSDVDTVLIEALLASEDGTFRSRKKGYDFSALVRSTFHAGWLTLRTRRPHLPRGTSTIQMQVARFLLLKSDSRGYAYTEKSVSRKIRELKLAQALFLSFSKDELLTCYINHCVSAGRGMVGFHDISNGLFGVPPDSLTIPQSLYLARLVKWNRHVPGKIIRQIKATLPALSNHFGWNEDQQERIARQLDSLTFRRPVSVLPENSYLIDCANEYLKKIGMAKGMSKAQLADLDIADPQSMLRLHGNASINLTIDYRLQSLLEQIVAERGFGPDTTIAALSSIGEVIDTLTVSVPPPDTSDRKIIISDNSFYDSLNLPDTLPVEKGDTLFVTIRHTSAGDKKVRRTRTVSRRTATRVSGQYYSYALMNAKTHELLAYCSRDRLGSRLRSLLVNRNPNGSSVAKPLIYALAYDLGIYHPTDMASDDTEIPDTCLWSRIFLQNGTSQTGMIYQHVPEKSGYPVRNHDRRYAGYDFLFNHLAHSNNIIAVETMFRLSSELIVNTRKNTPIATLARRFGLTSRGKRSPVTGPQLYAAMVGVCRGSVITSKRIAENYSVALGTLELSLYEQMHLFNVLYDNRLLRHPAAHPSLFIKRVRLSGEEILFSDSAGSVGLFKNVQSLAPVRLALYKRLISNPSDRLDPFDICGNDALHLSNFAKSGTTDDVIRPFNASATDTSRTNYGLWNAVLRLRLKREDLRNAVDRSPMSVNQKKVQTPLDSIPVHEDLDVTLACIGECNARYTGPRDGKSLHGYISRELLRQFGIPCTTGFYRSYEAGLVAETPDKVKYAGGEKSNLSFFSRALVHLQSDIGKKSDVDEVRFEKPRFGKGIRLRGRHLRKMLRFALYTGYNSKEYRKLIGRLKHPDSHEQAREIISNIIALDISNRVMKRDLDRACQSLLESLDVISEEKK